MWKIILILIATALLMALAWSGYDPLRTKPGGAALQSTGLQYAGIRG